MNKKDWAIIIGASIYSFLFYDQGAGLNLLLFSVLVVGIFIYLDKHILQKKVWIVVATLTIFSGLFVFLYGSALSVLGNRICLLLLAGFSNNSRSSVILNLFSSIYSVLGSLVFIILKLVNSPKNSSTTMNSSMYKVIGVLLPIVFILIFFFIYKSINPLFEKYTNFVSGEWIIFTIVGLFIMYGLIRQERISKLDELERNLDLNINKDFESTEKWNERTSISILFIALNIMLIFINVLDVNYLYLGSGMPKGLTHKEFVHNGVGMLVLSIILGICIIFYFFRGSLNFSDKNKPFKLLVYFWLFQNLMMVISTTLRNKMYIDDALLTYKRIGVYYWLFMAMVGLLTTFIKVAKAKSAWYLIKHNSFIAFVVLILSGGVDWDRFISTYNISKAKLLAAMDKRYLISLSETNIAQLYAIKDKSGFNIDSLFHYRYYYRSTANDALLDSKLFDYLYSEQKNSYDWRSYNVRKQRIKDEITDLRISGKIKKLDLTSNYIQTLKPIINFNQLEELCLGGCSDLVLNEIIQFKYLKKISISYISETQLKLLRIPPSLKHIRLKHTTLDNAEKLKKLVSDSVKVE